MSRSKKRRHYQRRQSVRGPTLTQAQRAYITEPRYEELVEALREANDLESFRDELDRMAVEGPPAEAVERARTILGREEH